MATSINLKKTPNEVRFFAGTGLAATDLARVERDGGDYGAGIIRGVSLVKKGEALGHNQWIDETFIEQVADAANEKSHGLKVRFTHPSLSGDGLGTLTARAKDIQFNNDAAVGDLHIVKSARATPDGNLADYVLDLADETPEDFGMSIAFLSDVAASKAYMFQHLDEETGEFESPDEDNENNFPHVRLKALRAADIVDEPAANPDGLFYGKGQRAAIEGEQLLSFVFGLTEEVPELSDIPVDPIRIAHFVTRFATRNGITFNKEDLKMSEDVKAVEVDETPAAPEITAAPEYNRKAEGAKFIEAFGEVDGAIYFATGLSFEEAQVQFTKKLREENEQLRQQLSAGSVAGVQEAPEFSVVKDDTEKKGMAQFMRRVGT